MYATVEACSAAGTQSELGVDSLFEVSFGPPSERPSIAATQTFVGCAAVVWRSSPFGSSESRTSQEKRAREND